MNTMSFGDASRGVDSPPVVDIELHDLAIIEGGAIWVPPLWIGIGIAGGGAFVAGTVVAVVAYNYFRG